MPFNVGPMELLVVLVLLVAVIVGFALVLRAILK